MSKGFSRCHTERKPHQGRRQDYPHIKACLLQTHRQISPSCDHQNKLEVNYRQLSRRTDRWMDRWAASILSNRARCSRAFNALAFLCAIKMTPPKFLDYDNIPDLLDRTFMTMAMTFR